MAKAPPAKPRAKSPKKAVAKPRVKKPAEKTVEKPAKELVKKATKKPVKKAVKKAAKAPAKTPAKASPKSRAKIRRQYAALPWRLDAEGATWILLITSRETRRWVIPKGWPIKGLTPGLAAGREAYEEAGVEGYAATSALGLYRYDKLLPGGRIQTVDVEVFALQVSEENAEWPEKGQREKRWVSRAEAVEMVDEPGLKALIEGFRRDAG